MMKRVTYLKLILFSTAVGVLSLSIFLSQMQPNSPKKITYITSVEMISKSEARSINEIRTHILDALQTQYPPAVRPMRRDVHAKQHGCVKAIFEVRNQNLPPELRVGIFARNQTFPAWIRFSNASSSLKADSSFDARGMAIKLMNVRGTKILRDESNEETQDFVLINLPIFFADTSASFMKITQTDKTFTVLFFLTHPHMLFTILPKILANVSNPLFIRYWSTTPYALGPVAVKYSAVPCNVNNSQKVDRHHENYLREAMTSTLNNSEVCFQFMVQLQNDAKKMPIEDPTVEWQEKQSPFIPVAKIRIISQKFDSDKQMEFCENTAFTPWHSLPENRPLGEINRARKVIYEAVSSMRHRANKVSGSEPRP
jgi:catalase